MEPSIWVEGSYLYIVSEKRERWRFQGAAVRNEPAAIPGSLWVEDAYLMYVDTGRNIRRIGGTSLGSVQGIVGSLWTNGDFLNWIDESQRARRWHADVSHSDVAAYYQPGHTNHSDRQHQNEAAVDYPYYSNHTDGYYNYNDIAPPYHGDRPAYPHSDGWGYVNWAHVDKPYSNHYDNVPDYYRPHSDTPHTDWPKRVS